MAFNDQITNRCKAEGFYRHVEWNREKGFLVKLHEETNSISFERGTFDQGYDERFPNHRQWFVNKRDAVKMMLNLEFNIAKIIKVLRMAEGGNVVNEEIKHVRSSKP